MREKLIELLEGKVYDEWYGNEEIADHLLANGVIVLPCKVGDTVYIVYWQKGRRGGHITEVLCSGVHVTEKVTKYGRNEKKRYIVVRHELSGLSSHLDIDKLGDSWFLTREEAKAALKEGQG